MNRNESRKAGMERSLIWSVLNMIAPRTGPMTVPTPPRMGIRTMLRLRRKSKTEPGAMY